MALFFTVLLGISVFVLGYFISEFNRSSLIREVEIAIDSKIANVRDNIESSPFRPLTDIIDSMERNHPNTYFTIQNPSGEYVYGDVHPDLVRVSLLNEGIILMDVEEGDFALSNFEGARRFAAKIETLDDGTRLFVATDVEDALQARDRLHYLGLLTIALMLIVIATSFFISTFVVGRLNTIWRTARSIMITGDLSQRIKVGTAWDDLSRLASVLNELLERIEELMYSVRQVSDNIAHDLRTPLTRLRSHMDELDQILKESKDTRSHEIAESLIGEADQILRTFNALLRIARIESGKFEQEFGDVNLEELLVDVLDLYQPVAEEKNVSINEVKTDLKTFGDRDMLFQLFANILDNAVKFTPENGKVEVSVNQLGQLVSISIADTGPGIKKEDKKRIFDRFYREEKSRTTPGSGLGLSLVYAVLKLHAGHIEVNDNNPGSRFEIFLKAI